MTGLRTVVIGAGLMGHGIALVMARGGHTVSIFEPDPENSQTVIGRICESMAGMGCDSEGTEQALSRISVYQELEPSLEKAGLVIEAAPEKLPLKRRIFADVEALVSQDCILASNTSVMPITDIMTGLQHRERALGTHWWNPPHMIPLVEVIRTEWTAADVMERMVGILDAAGKKPVRVEKDVPGFIGNRLQHALWREAISLVENGICDAQAVDDVIKSSFGRRLAVLGPLENADLVGTDLTLDIHNTVLQDLEARPDPSPLLQQMVSEGRLGMKSGQGFRSWTDDEIAATKARVSTHLKALEDILPD